MFINKKTKNNKTPTQTLIPTPQYTFCPYPFPFYNYNSSQFPLPYPSQSSTSGYDNSQASIPKISKFLEDLDEEFGVGKFTCYIENFVNESIDVLDILELTESDFDKLGITNIGIKTKLVRKAKQYCK
jgi:hypothetical protein